MTEEKADKAAAKLDAADDKSGECFPSLETLAKRTHLNRSSVRRSSRCTPIINISSIDHPDGHHQPPEASVEKPGRFDLGVARRNGTLNDVLT